MSRKKLPKTVETDVLTFSKRRCALYFGILADTKEKRGQIAHLDHNANNNFDNLAYLCFEHHDKYDSNTSVSKNYTKEEIIKYRNKLYEYYKVNSMKKSEEEIKILYKYLTIYQNLFEFLFTHGSESAHIFDDEPYILLEELINNWFCSRYKCNNKEIQEHQDIIYKNLVNIYNNILNKYEYDVIPKGIIFKWQDDQKYNSKFIKIKDEMKKYIINH